MIFMIKSIFKIIKEMRSYMSRQEKRTREVIIQFLMRENGLSRKETVASVKELEAFGLIQFNSNGGFRLKEV
jgi:hypothetical protein